tara:strand:- start:5433 stop:6608 length:1176 start_codon:yes stop_codon:yes gene_type:complete
MSESSSRKLIHAINENLIYKDEIFKELIKELKSLIKQKNLPLSDSLLSKLNLSVLNKLGTAGRFTIPKNEPLNISIQPDLQNVLQNSEAPIILIAHCGINEKRLHNIKIASEKLLRQSPYSNATIILLNLDQYRVIFDEEDAGKIHHKYKHWAPMFSLMVLSALGKINQNLHLISHPYFCSLVNDWNLNFSMHMELDIDCPINIAYCLMDYLKKNWKTNKNDSKKATLNIHSLSAEVMNGQIHSLDLFPIQLKSLPSNIKMLEFTILKKSLQTLEKHLVDWITNNNRIAIYGGGKHTKYLLKYSNLQRANIVAVIDKNPETLKTHSSVIKLKPNELSRSSPFDIVLISSISSQKECSIFVREKCGQNVKIFTLYKTDNQEQASEELSQLKC